MASTLELTITGNTYAHRGLIRLWGAARWDGATKTWHVTVTDVAAYRRSRKPADLVIQEVARPQTTEEKAAIAERRARLKRAKTEADAFDWTAFSLENADLYDECRAVEEQDPHRKKQKIWRRLKSGRDALSAITDVEVLRELASRHRGVGCEDNPNVLRWILRGLSYWGAAHKVRLDYEERGARALAHDKGLEW